MRKAFLFYISFILSLLVACSTTRKTVKTETMTQISQTTADTSSLHATIQREDSTTKESWEELVVEWDRPLSPTLPQMGGSEADTLKTELGKMLDEIRKAGVTKATIRKGAKEMTVTKTQTDSTSERQTITKQNVATCSDTQEEVKKGRAAWKYVTMYVLVMALIAGVILGVKWLVNRL